MTQKVVKYPESERSSSMGMPDCGVKDDDVVVVGSVENGSKDIVGS